MNKFTRQAAEASLTLGLHVVVQWPSPLDMLLQTEKCEYILRHGTK